jgi:hypothetical protein
VRTLVAALAAVLFAFVAPLAGRSDTPALDAQTVIDRMVSRNPSLGSYQARVHVALHMLNFPFLAPKLDGTSYFKRPNNYEVVFDRVPGYAKGFSKLFDDVGDPIRWEREQNITLQGTQIVDGRPQLVLVLTKKIHSDILDHTTAFIDPQTYELTRMEWHYRSGGTIVLTQHYRTQGQYSVVAAQHVTIDIPHVHAVGDSSFGTYQTNVAVDDTVFEHQP